MNRQDAKIAKEKRKRMGSEPSLYVDELARNVIGAAIEVHRHLGPGYLESVYEEALAIEFELRGIPCQRQAPFSVSFKGHKVGNSRLDFLVDKNLIVELKAVEAFVPIHKATVINYLRTLGHELALLINFNVPVLKDGIRRIVLTNQK